MIDIDKMIDNVPSEHDLINAVFAVNFIVKTGQKN
jgi:hypothetical protein